MKLQNLMLIVVVLVLASFSFAQKTWDTNNVSIDPFTDQPTGFARLQSETGIGRGFFDITGLCTDTEVADNFDDYFEYVFSFVGGDIFYDPDEVLIRVDSNDVYTLSSDFFTLSQSDEGIALGSKAFSTVHAARVGEQSAIHFLSLAYADFIDNYSYEDDVAVELLLELLIGEKVFVRATKNGESKTFEFDLTGDESLYLLLNEVFLCDLEYDPNYNSIPDNR